MVGCIQQDTKRNLSNELAFFNFYITVGLLFPCFPLKISGTSREEGFRIGSG